MRDFEISPTLSRDCASLDTGVPQGKMPWSLLKRCDKAQISLLITGFKLTSALMIRKYDNDEKKVIIKQI